MAGSGGGDRTNKATQQVIEMLKKLCSLKILC